MLQKERSWFLLTDGGAKSTARPQGFLVKNCVFIKRVSHSGQDAGPSGRKANEHIDKLITGMVPQPAEK
jgi:hypothetical protein